MHDAGRITGDGADQFVGDNKSLIDLTTEQQARLLASTIGPYEHKVRTDITVPLTPYQFDALVSFLYNPGQGWPAVRKAVNNGDFHAAVVAMRRQIKSGRKIDKGLIRRRRLETNLLMIGNYGPT